VARFICNVEDCLGVVAEADVAHPDELAAIEAEEAHLLSPEWLGRVGRKLVPAGVKLAAGVHLTEGCHKAPGGLLRARLLERDGAIADLELSGDIDCRPAHGLAALAQQLRGVPLDDCGLVDFVSKAMERLGVIMLRAGASDIAAVIVKSRHIATAL
jgi:lipoate-protein ligase A